LIEQGRQELLAGNHERAAALLAEAYRASPDDFVIKQLLGTTMRALEANERIQDPTLANVSDMGGSRIEVSPNGTRYVARLGDRLWLGSTEGKTPQIALGDRMAAEWPHFSPDSRFVTGASGSAFRVWDAVTGTRLHEVTLDRPVNWVGFSRDSAHAIVLAVDGSWGAWSTASGQKIRFVEALDKALPVTGLSLGRAGIGARPGTNYASSVVDELFPVAMADGKVTVWDWQRGTPVQRFEHGGELGSPFSTDFDGTTLITCGMDNRIKRWDARAGKLLVAMTESTGSVMTCALSPTGEIASVSLSGELRVWSETGVVTLSIEGEPSIVRFTPDGHRLLVQHGGTRETALRDGATGTVVARLGISGILAMQKDRVFLVRPDGAVDVVRLRSFGVARDLPGYAHSPRVDLDADARTLLWNEPDGRVMVHDLARDQRVVLPITGPRSLSTDGSHVIGWGERGITILRTTGELVREIAVAEAPYRLAISDDHRQAVGKFVDGKIVVWDIATGDEISTLENDPHDLIGLDHGRVVLWTQLDSLAFWDPATRRTVKIAHTAWEADISDDGGLAWISDGDHVAVIDTRTGERKLVVPGTYAAFDRAGSVFVRSGDEVSRWSTNTWQRSGAFIVSAGVTALKIVVNPSGQLVATSKGIWETRSGRLLAKFDPGGMRLNVESDHMQTSIDWVSFSKRGDELRIQTPNGGSVLDVRPETRSPDEVHAIVARRQPWRVIDGKLTVPARASNEPLAYVRARAIYRGAPVAGAKVISGVSGQYRQVGTTGEDGTFELVRKRDKYKITVVSDVHGAFGEAELEATEQAPVVDIAMTFEATIAGRIVDRKGQPRANMHVRVESEAKDDSGDAKTDRDGRFRIGALRGGKTYVLHVRDQRTGTLVPTTAPLPKPLVETATTHVEGIQIVAEDEPVIEGELDAAVFHRLTTRWQPTRSLDVLDFRPTGPYSGQLWKLERRGGGYRLTTKFKGDDNPLGLEGERPAIVKNGTQTWELTRTADGSYRIKSAGDARCLTAGLRFVVAPCTDTTDQSWLITPTTARTK
jgi:WD40 repeat protein